MIARFTGATLGLLAFTVVTLGGLWVGNSVYVTLSRAIGSLGLFCLLGLVVGGAAQAVVNDHARCRLEAVPAAADSPSRAEGPAPQPETVVFPAGSGATG